MSDKEIHIKEIPYENKPILSIGFFEQGSEK